MIKYLSKHLSILAMLSFATASHAAPITLVKDGKPNATIITQADAPKPIQAAGEDLQKYIQKISGVQLPLKTDGKAAEGITLNIGKTDSATAADLPDSQLNPETYAIRQRGNDVYFVGNNPSPSAFAVYAFLQDQLGVRWFAPGEDWEYVPQSTSGNLTVDVQEVVKTPDISPRVWSGHHWTRDWSDWNLRNKTVQSEQVPRRNFQNNMYRVFPQSKYAKTHPEYFPLINGKRWFPTDDSYRNWWPCMGNKDVQRITLEYAQEYFRKNPNTDSFSLGMDDIYNMCSCDLCRAMDANPDDYETNKFSNRFYTFVNIIAKELKKTHPDKYIGTLIYHIARDLPEKVDKLEDNVFGYITQNSANWYVPEIEQADMAVTREWAKRVTHLSRYDYFGLGTFTPRFYPHLMDKALKFDKSLGFDGMYVELYTFLPHTAPMVWAFAQLEWDAQKNIDELLNEFYAKMYPSTTATMKEYFDLLEQSWMESRPGRISSEEQHRAMLWEHRSIQNQATSISKEATLKGLQLLNRAYAQAQTPIEKRRIDVVRGGLKFASYAILIHNLAQELSTLEVTSHVQAEAGLQKILELSTLSNERGPVWEKLENRKDLLGENIRGLTDRPAPYIQRNFTVLERPALPGILRTTDWVQKNQPELMKNFLDSLPDGNIKSTLIAHQWVATEEFARSQSLLTNGDFESTKENQAKPEADWQTKGVPFGWSSWSRNGLGEFTRVTGAQTDSRGIAINAPATGETAILLQSTRIDSNEKYLALASVNLKNPEQSSSTKLNVRFRDAKGKILENTSVQPESKAGWQRLLLPVTPPKNTASVIVMLSVSASEAVFDDVELHKLP